MSGDNHSRKLQSLEIIYPQLGVVQIELCNLSTTEITTWRSLQVLLHYFSQDTTTRAIILVLDTNGDVPLETGVIPSDATITQGTFGRSIAAFNEMHDSLSHLTARKKRMNLNYNFLIPLG